MTERMSAAEYRAIVAKAATRGNKFGAQADWRCRECGLPSGKAPCLKCGGETIRFDSKAEARRWDFLRRGERIGQVFDLERQVRYPIRLREGQPIPPIVPTVAPDAAKPIPKTVAYEHYMAGPGDAVKDDGSIVGSYYADFRWRDTEGVVHVEDVKGGRATDTALSRFKRRCVEQQYGIKIEVVRS